MQLSEQQNQAIDRLRNRKAWKNRRAWLGGFAGSGKTTIARHLVEAIGARRPLYVAPTNKAARVLERKVGRAMTIHSAIYYPPGENPNGSLGWTINANGDAAHADLIVCDEASMVGTKLGADLASFGVPILAIGDPGQLPPINDTWFFCTGEPDFMLTEIHRQAAENPIIALSQAVREGHRMETGTMGEAVRIARRGTVDIPTEDMPQIIVGTHKRRWAITEAVRAMLGYDGWLPNPGEKLLIRKNSEHHPELINGEGTVCERCEQGIDAIDLWANGRAEPYKTWDGYFREHVQREPLRPEYLSPDWIGQKQFEGIDFGHAITCHSAQGSQWDDVVVYDEAAVFRQDARRWLYTAVTRAAERLTVII